MEKCNYLCIWIITNKNDMCTVTLSYDSNNALARRKLAALLNTGLFVKKQESERSLSEDEQKEHKQEVEAFLYSSKRNMSNIIARYLQ